MVFTLTYGLVNAAVKEISKGRTIASAHTLTKHFICKYEIKDEHFSCIYATMQRFRRKRLSSYGTKTPDDKDILLVIKDADDDDLYDDHCESHETDQLYEDEVEAADEVDADDSCYRTSLLDLKRHAR